MSRRKLNLTAKVAKVFRAVKKLERNGHNPEYDWTRATDVFEQVRDRLFAAGILIHRDEGPPEYVDQVTNGEGWLQECRVSVTYYFTDGESETKPERCNGVARKANSDKALYVAQTGADKAFLKRKGLMAEVVDDPEFEEEITEETTTETIEQYTTRREPRKLKTVSEKQIYAFQKACDDHGKSPEEQLVYLEKVHNVHTVAELGRGRPFSDALDWASNGEAIIRPKAQAVPAQTDLPLRTASGPIEMKIGNEKISFEPKDRAYSV